MSASSTPRSSGSAATVKAKGRATTPPTIVKLSNKEINDNKAMRSSPEDDPSNSKQLSSASSMDEEVVKLDQATIEASLNVPTSIRNKGKVVHIQKSIETLDVISKAGIMALKKRSSSTDSDTSSLSDALSLPDSDNDMDDASNEDSDDGTDMPDAEGDSDSDAEEPAPKATSMSFDQKISAAVAQATRSKTQSSPKKAAGSKHCISPPASGPQKKKACPPKKIDRSAEASIEVQKLPYQSIISIAMPPRIGLVAGQPAPEPDENNLPYGDTEDYHNSMIIHYMDECEMTYTKAAEVYSDKFPRDVITDEAIRKRHIRSLLRLKKKFGTLDPDTIPKPSKSVIRRGTPRAKKVSAITPVADDSAPTTPTTDAPAVPKYRKLLHPRLFEKTLIVTWRDDTDLSWKDIQTKLENEYKWSLGMGTIEKYYYTSLERVYGKGGKKEKNAEKKEDDGEEGEERRREDGDFRPFVERLVERRMSL